jgi:hypothetical protein
MEKAMPGLAASRWLSARRRAAAARSPPDPDPIGEPPRHRNRSVSGTPPSRLSSALVFTSGFGWWRPSESQPPRFRRRPGALACAALPTTIPHRNGTKWTGTASGSSETDFFRCWPWPPEADRYTTCEF